MNGQQTAAFHLSGKALSKSFSYGSSIFSGVDISIRNGEVLGITGDNGAGKSTLLRILAGILPPSSGTLSLSLGGQTIASENFTRHIGFVSPYLTIYEEFSPLEHLLISAQMRGIKFNEEQCNFLLEKFRLYKRRADVIKTFSSGMKQRMKYILALQHDPALLFLDEPTTNIDQAGIEVIKSCILESAGAGKGVVIATNEERERALCSSVLEIVPTRN